MKTITINLYKFEELSESAKIKALDNLRDTNVTEDWWELTYEDAERIGLLITGFNDYKCTGRFESGALSCAQMIIENHGEHCETFKTASNFLKERDALLDFLGEDADDSHFKEIDAEFLKSMLEDYRIMIRESFEYLQSDESVTDTINANSYDFTEEWGYFKGSIPLVFWLNQLWPAGLPRLSSDSGDFGC